jgi:hypothetical protein
MMSLRLYTFYIFGRAKGECLILNSGSWLLNSVVLSAVLTAYSIASDLIPRTKHQM